MIRRKWLVLRITDNKVEVLDRCWTEQGARRAHSYWSVLHQAVGNRAKLDVVHDVQDH